MAAFVCVLANRGGSMINVLVLAPHPDDEAIGCGGRLRLHAYNGDRISVVYLTSGEGGEPGKPPAEVAQRREEESRDAMLILGISEAHYWEEPDGALDVRPELEDRLRGLMERLQIDVLYAPHDGEAHADHAAAGQLAEAVLHHPAPAHELELWSYEVWTPMADPDSVVDISSVIGIKVQAIRAYASQCARIRFDEAALALARYRGELRGRPHGPFAEVFRSVQ